MKFRAIIDTRPRGKLYVATVEFMDDGRKVQFAAPTMKEAIDAARAYVKETRNEDQRVD